ncbi:MAG: hypothetical protein AAF108_11530, partial [Planctomycetota bacterium]
MSSERKLEEACGLFGVVALEQPAPQGGDGPAETRHWGEIAMLGLEQLQHRGHESSGLVGASGRHGDQHFRIHKGLGLVKDVYKGPAALEPFADSRLLIGHNRYSTAGVKD